MATLDRTQSFGECFGGVAKYVQDGVYFDSSDNEIKPKTLAKLEAKAAAGQSETNQQIASQLGDVPTEIISMPDDSNQPTE